MDAAQKLWARYRASGDPEARHELILNYLGLVKYVVGRLPQARFAGVDYQDLVGYGIIGLMDAIEKYDPSKDVKFETYAILRIRGAILDSLRALDWAPRSVRQKARDLEAAYAALELTLGRPAEDEEVAAYLGISVEALRKRQDEIAMANCLSLDELVSVDQDSKTATILDVLYDPASPDPELTYEAHEMAEVLAKAIDTLPERERLVISLYYYNEMTIKEIAAILGVSDSRVSQLHTKALARLRGKLRRMKEAALVG